MNIPAIKRNCVRKKWFEIVDDLKGGQWIGNGQAWWAVEGIEINEGCVADLFDLSEKQVDKCLITRTASTDRRFRRIIDGGDAGDLCEDMGAVWFNGWLMRAIYHDRLGMMFLLVDLLKPARADDEYCTFYALEADGDVMVAVFDGFFCTALVRPVDGNVPAVIQDRLRRMADAPLYMPDGPDAVEEAVDGLAEQMEIGRATFDYSTGGGDEGARVSAPAEIEI